MRRSEAGNKGFGCTLSALPYLNKVWRGFRRQRARATWIQDSSSIFLLRNTFFVPASWTQDLQVGIAVDNDVEVFVNGTAVTPTNGATPLFVTHEGCAAQDAPGWCSRCQTQCSTRDNRTSWRFGPGTAGGESYIDARLSPTTPLTPPSP